jgi:hypothetical protein
MRKLLLLLFVTMTWAGAACADNAAPVPSTIKGKVLEVLEVESFSYLRLQTKDGEIWAAVSKAPIVKGTELTLENVTMMKDFESKTLKKRFDKVAFGTLAGSSAGAGATSGANAASGSGTNAASGGAANAASGSGPSAAAGAAPMGGAATGADLDMGTFHAGIAKSADVGDIKVAKAAGPNARTVAEIVTAKAELKDKTVEVRGKIVKFTAGVLGKNWIHLRDGTGQAASGTNDLVVTTKDDAKIGDVVLVKGVVHIDRDFGSGYSYPVLVEEATLRK